MLKIRRSVYNSIIQHAQEDPSIEACGYLAEKDGVVETPYRLTNTDASKEHFSMDPKEQFETVRKIRSESQKLKAVYHSHPETPARPSEEDKKLAYDPDISYVIVSLASEKPDVKSFSIRNKIVTHQEIEITE